MSLKLLAGSGHPSLAAKIERRIGYPTHLNSLSITRFSNGELLASVSESVRDEDVFILSTASEPVNDVLMELLIAINACKIASARRVIAVLPCFPYARQNRKERPRAAITGKLVASLIEAAGCIHLITMDLHASQIQGFFNNIPVDKAASLASNLEVDLALLHGPHNNHTLLGSVTNKTAILIDNIADTCDTIATAATVLQQHGAEKCVAVITHGLFGPEGVQRIEESWIEKVAVLDTVPLSQEAMACNKIVSIDVSIVFAEAIRRVHNGESISKLW